MSNVALRVGIDLSGSLEPMGDTMNDLAVSLTERGIDMVPFASSSGRHRITPRRTFRTPISQLWRHGYGPAIDRFLVDVDVIHVAGRQIPPTLRTPLVVSVDDLRPLIDNDDTNRVAQLQLAVARGAIVVATSYAARRRVVRALNVEAHDVAVAFPAVPRLGKPQTRRFIVVSVTGAVHHFLSMAPDIVQHAKALNLSVVALASKEAGSLIRSQAPEVSVAPRHSARKLLGDAHTVIHLSDGARFPSLPIAAIGCELPVVTTSTDVNRELLEGCVDFISADDTTEAMAVISRTLSDAPHRGLLASAGQTRARDFTPDVAAQRYEGLYRDAVASWSR